MNEIQKRLLSRLARFLTAVAISVALCQFTFDYLESLLYDVRVRLRPATPPSGHIELVVVDGHTLDVFKRSPNAKDFADLLKKLQAAAPKAVISYINPSELSGTYEELESYAKAAQQLPQFYIGIDDTIRKGQEQNFRLAPPLHDLQILSAPTTYDRFSFSKDNVTRRLMISFFSESTLDLMMAQLFNPELTDESKIRGAFNYLDSNQAFIDFRPAHTYPTTSFADLIADAPHATANFKNKIVLIGRDTSGAVKDYIMTPHSRSLMAMTTVEMHANIIDTLIQNSAPYLPPDWLNYLLTALVSALTILVVLKLRPAQGMIALFTILITFLLWSYLMFWWFGVWIRTSHPLLAIFVSHYFFIPYRLVMENRRSWEYYQKNKLLTQVEELKNNFISMMSHDLKTPIARIQGMTDVALKDPHPLSAKQKEAMLGVSRSAEELLEFISSILNLGRIESQDVTLHLQSRDLNTLLTEVVEKLEYQAHEKKIEIKTELEPLFSTKIDVDLMKQVFSNLIENAIKYSPADSRVLISTEERDGWIVAQVADQGIGIPDNEVSNIFMKFYRSKNAKSSNIKGSGLGLYLAKYFVELHHGRLSVDSTPGQGSTFTVELPTS